MRRLSLWIAVGMLALSAGGIVAALVAMTQHVPAFYQRASQATEQQRKEYRNSFVTKYGRITKLLEDVKGGLATPINWGQAFTEAEVNAFFADNFFGLEEAKDLLPEGASQPRIQFDQDRVRLGFRYENFLCSTIISIDFRVWLPQAQPNVVVVELQGLHAGALPISAQSLLEDISTTLTRQRIQLSWYRHHGNPTAALKFPSDEPRPTAVLQKINLKPGILEIVGRSSDVYPDSSAGP
jgi:hypothetical protein